MTNMRTVIATQSSDTLDTINCDSDSRHKSNSRSNNFSRFNNTDSVRLGSSYDFNNDDIKSLDMKGKNRQMDNTMQTKIGEEKVIEKVIVGNHADFLTMIVSLLVQNLVIVFLKVEMK
ncbi:86_t:CDS:2 [Funneliformis caledonium]|uniref:86_t:CDS:1 n=1 Tax=Funneliformis caledonium TaxID=1117310 RepID=A0A9N9GE60_9GLOM|nr:86_t:CDS:2 [Funneliformis caledonium]